MWDTPANLRMPLVAEAEHPDSIFDTEKCVVEDYLRYPSVHLIISPCPQIT